MAGIPPKADPPLRKNRPYWIPGSGRSVRPGNDGIEGGWTENDTRHWSLSFPLASAKRFSEAWENAGIQMIFPDLGFPVLPATG